MAHLGMTAILEIFKIWYDAGSFERFLRYQGTFPPADTYPHKGTVAILDLFPVSFV
jgi:hypothetical protein